MISAIIPTMNRCRILKKNIEILESYGIDEIIVIDGASVDDTHLVMKHLKKRYDNIIYIRTEKRKGAPTARNIGINNSNGGIILMLDDDRILEDRSSIDAIQEDFKLNEHIGIIGAAIDEVKIPRIDPPFKLKRQYARPLTRLTGFVFSEYPTEHLSFSDYVSSTMAIRREVFSDLRYDKGYKGTFYREETDFQLMARKLGWLIIFDPRFKVKHYGTDYGGARGKKFRGRIYWKSKNHTYFLLKHFKGTKLFWYLLNTIFILSLYTPLFVPTIIKGIKDGFHKRTS